MEYGAEKNLVDGVCLDGRVDKLSHKFAFKILKDDIERRIM